MLLAVPPLPDGIGGRYFADCNESEVVHRTSGNLGGVADYAVDPANAERLWTVSDALTAGATCRYCIVSSAAPRAHLPRSASRKQLIVSRHPAHQAHWSHRMAAGRRAGLGRR